MASYYSSPGSERESQDMYSRDPGGASYPMSSALGNLLYLNNPSSGPYTEFSGILQTQQNFMEMPGQGHHSAMSQDSSARESQDMLASHHSQRSFCHVKDMKNEMLMHMMDGAQSGGAELIHDDPHNGAQFEFGVLNNHDSSDVPVGQGQGQGLSLSLNTQILAPSLPYRSIKPDMLTPNSYQESLRIDDIRMKNMQSEASRAIRHSRYLKAAQEVLDEVVNVWKNIKQKAQKEQAEPGKADGKETDGGPKSEGASQESGANAAPELSTAEKQELQNKMAKLMAMLDEVDRKYKHYYHQMQNVVASFDMVAGPGSAKPYTAVVLQTISRHFRCLKDAINDQINVIRKKLGEEENSWSHSSLLMHDLKTKQDEPDNITNKHFKCMPKDSFNINVQQVPNRETSSDVEQISILRTTEEKQKTLSMTKDTSMDRCEELHQLQMDRAITLRNELESMLTDESAEPKRIPLSLLELITNGFSDDGIIGYGGFARVYKGMLGNGTIAVKKLVITVDIDENNFIEEVRCLMNAKHKNIVRFLGYCSESQGEMVDFNGQFVLADLRQRVLCFEYLSEGSLEKKINDASCGLEWSTRYEIIDGICAGLYYLHKKRIVHLDLKPANILLDHNMMPKIADFGLSRRFCEDQSKIITSKKLTGTIGYMAPEFWGGQITLKCDLYSLGIIIIEILTGAKGCPNIDDVCESWINRLEKTETHTQLVQLRVCTEIAIECTDFNPVKRPDIEHIIDKLRAAKSAEESAASSHKGQESF